MVPVFCLLNLQYEEVAEKDDLMGVEDTGKKDILSKGAGAAREGGLQAPRLHLPHPICTPSWLVFGAMEREGGSCGGRGRGGRFRHRVALDCGWPHASSPSRPSAAGTPSSPWGTGAT